MVIIPFPFLFFHYIKKEDARDLLKKQRKFIPIILFAVVGVAVIIQFFVSPKIFSLYKDLNEPVPFMTQISSYVVIAITAVCSIIISIYLKSTPPNYERLDKVLAKYKEGEMIKTREILDFRYEIVIFVLLGVIVGYLVLSNIVPIYNLTNKY
ncbi:MAG: hypothetical protein UV54_C0041G0007 [Candidatus Beckwithbacteria bacterium GW2011_GWA2_43_10]|uniref:Uncharacterized protein n=1 Tax=Candidatus Beckwithbacteria bacterium GW2011_GWA2_43_10 TaxID=1618369 RepID=A0A0G1EX30_9BACT|nr:MAG: hypothetical protein UV54_C0041G0007 [Candidatus Beckwithbacteria bacterium GW2011_GWA2_43_10]